MQIGELARRSEVTVDTVRYYERRGLLRRPWRVSASPFHPGYREYDDEALDRLRFVRQGRGLGFSLSEIGELMELRYKADRACEAVMERAETKLAEVDARIRELHRVRGELSRLLEVCRPDEPGESCTYFDEGRVAG